MSATQYDSTGHEIGGGTWEESPISRAWKRGFVCGVLAAAALAAVVAVIIKAI